MINTYILIAIVSGLFLISVGRVLLLNWVKVSAKTFLIVLVSSTALSDILAAASLYMLYAPAIVNTFILCLIAANTFPLLAELRRGLELLKYEHYKTAMETVDKLNYANTK